MRAWLYDLLVNDAPLAASLGFEISDMARQVMPRQSRDTINGPRPFLIYGLGNNTNEDLAEATDHIAHRQFFTVWVHDEGGDYSLIEEAIERLKSLLENASDPVSHVTTVRWLETSQEFANETYNTIFRYARFQAIISRGDNA